MDKSALQQLSELYGIRLADASLTADSHHWQEWHVCLLQAAGLAVSSEDEARARLAEEGNFGQKAHIEPTVARESELPLRVRIFFPESNMQNYRWLLQEESGREWHGDFSPSAALPDSRSAALSSGLRECVIATVQPLSFGYHRLAIYGRDDPTTAVIASAPVIVAPDCCYVPPGLSGQGRVWGLSLDLHAVRSNSNWGIGDFADLHRILSWAARQGAGAVRTSPLTCLNPGQSRYNPYCPSSRANLDPLYVNLEEVITSEDHDEVRALFHDARYQARLAALRSQDEIDHEAIAQLKEDVFRLLWQHFSAYHLNPETARGNAFRQFQQTSGDVLRSFARYAAIEEKYANADSVAADWRNWPEPLRHPRSDAVDEFARQHAYDIEYQHYKQWLAAEQLAAVGRRSMELGLKVGLVAEFPFSFAEDGFESWLNQDLLFTDARIILQEQSTGHADAAAGLPLLVPKHLKSREYQPLIAGLRHTMAQAGAICIQSIEKYFSATFQLATERGPLLASARYHAEDLLNIFALESHRNQCLVIADHLHLLSPEHQAELAERNFFASHVLFEKMTPEHSFLDDGALARSVLCTSASFISGLKGLWKGEDIRTRTEERMFRNDRQREQALLARAAARACFLITLEHERLLPAGSALDQANIPEIDDALMLAGQVLAARSAARLMLVTFNDLLGTHLQASTPAMSDQAYWRSRYALPLEELFEDPKIASVFEALRRERGVGVRRPSAPSSGRGQGLERKVPSAFYRLQLHKGFGFLQAAEIVPYLQGLGISHCYLSPFLMARPGSPHGYDIIDHCRLNPEIGSREDFEKFIDVLSECGMALLLDIVPNHMGIGSDNSWWMDVLENGQASIFAGFFDINWTPLQWDMVGRLLLPVLGEHYGATLEAGHLFLTFDEAAGAFCIGYYQHSFPLDPATYPDILTSNLGRLSTTLGEQNNHYMEYLGIVSGFTNLPDREHCSGEAARIRSRDKEINKHLLARLCRHSQEVRTFIEENVIRFNGEHGKPASFDLLHSLLEKQVFRLAFWRVAADEINYRRFFDINDLAGLRMEEKQVFSQTHELVIDLISTGKVDGLRIDHPDGLYDPFRYFQRIEDAVMHDSSSDDSSVTGSSSGQSSIYVVVEKILADYEQLPRLWPVSGTTGYDFSHCLNAIFVEETAEKSLTSLYSRFIGRQLDFDELLYTSKRHIITSAMAGELQVLTSLLFRIARENRNSRDFTFNLLRQGLTEVVASFPVYRTYITSENIDKQDVEFIQWAISGARARTVLNDISVFDFIQRVLLLDVTCRELVPRYLDFVMKMQQYTGPVMAKGLEDTAFYIYNRLLSLNEVGGNPRRFGMSLAAFHQGNMSRLRHWPKSMVNSSTHDSKRSEDVRARINVLSEMVPLWRKRLLHWHKLNRPWKTAQEGLLIPDKNDEYAFYQNLLGSWPGEPLDESQRQHFVERLTAATIKACKEAKCHTSWMSPNVPYERAVRRFIEGVLDNANTEFLHDFEIFHEGIAWFGMLNSLSQVLLKLVVPGIPDIYQGNELFRYCLVDPDNRRPVDFTRRQALLAIIEQRLTEHRDGIGGFQRELLESFTTGGAKMYTVYQALTLRKQWPDVFSHGSYLPLQTTGSRHTHVCAFMRIRRRRAIIAAVPRFYFQLLQGKAAEPLGMEVWGNTGVNIPRQGHFHEMVWTPLFSDRELRSEVAEDNVCTIRAGDLFHSWPVALLKGTVDNA